jgi:hypothetical protein
MNYAQALSDAAQAGSEEDKAILKSTAGLFLFGVPSSGLNDHNLLSITKGNRKRLVSDLMEGSALLRMLNQSFIANCHPQGSIQIVSFYETNDTPATVHHPF